MEDFVDDDFELTAELYVDTSGAIYDAECARILHGHDLAWATYTESAGNIPCYRHMFFHSRSSWYSVEVMRTEPNVLKLASGGRGDCLLFKHVLKVLDYE
jgi:hypothetical protein